MSRNFVLTFRCMERSHIGKDVSCVPYYLSKALDCKPTVVSLSRESNADLPEYLGGIHYHKLPAKTGILPFWWYLIRNARKVDILMRFHYSSQTVYETILYKWLNPKGKVYVKFDADHHIAEKFKPWRPFKFIRRCLYMKAIKCIDVCSCETTGVFNVVTASPLPYFALGDKLVLVPNGFDEEHLQRTGIALKPFAEKENLMITVGRLGTRQKNTEMLLEALTRINMQGEGGGNGAFV